LVAARACAQISLHTASDRQVSADFSKDDTLKILIVEDHPIVIAGCRALFADDAGVVIEDARTATDGLRLYDEFAPDVAIVDVNLPDISGFEVTRQIRGKDPKARILIFTMNDAPVLAAQALQSGALGYIGKNDDPLSLREAIFKVARGQPSLPPSIAQTIAMSKLGLDTGPKLSARQIELLRLLAKGRSLSEIASSLDLSYKTVATDCAALRQKLEARTQTELIRIAISMNLV
jgi:DNA-binding NarL/FixJ family response regulator